MKLASLSRLVSKAEPWIAGVYLFYLLGIDIPPPLASLLNLSFYAILPLLIARCWKQVLYVATKDIFLILLSIMAIASIIWSIEPTVTSTELKPFIRGTLFGVYLAVRFGLNGEIRILTWLFGIGTILSLLVGVGIPSYGVHTTGEFVGAWKGIFMFKNLFAAQVAISALLFLILALNNQKQRWLMWSLFFISFMMLNLSRGKTALACFFISLYLMPLYSFIQHRYKWKTVFLTTSLLFSLGLVVLTLSNLELIVVDFLGKNLEFNGRLPIWSLMIEKGLEQPWLGYGYSAFWVSEAPYFLLTHTWARGAFLEGVRFNAHNGYIDLFLQLGFVGLFLYLAGFLTTLGRTIYLLVETRSIEFFWMFQILIFLLLINCGDSLSIASGGGQWSLYVSFVSITAIQVERIRKDKRLGSIPGEVQLSS